MCKIRERKKMIRNPNMEGNKDKMIRRQEKDNNMARREIKERKMGLKNEARK
jgi:hypothetical protein